MSFYLKALLLSFIVICAGCASSSSYVTPGGPANFGDINREDIAQIMAIKPAANFPARFAIVRVQAPNYVSYSTEGYRSGCFSIITTLELGTDKKIEDMAHWPQVTAVSTINRLLLSPNMKSLEDLRIAAAKLHADILIIYTLDTTFRIHNRSYASLSILSLGIMPDRDAKVTSSASAIFTDVRTGYVYGTADATASTSGLANAWTSDTAIDKKRLEAEQETINKLFIASKNTWQGIIKYYGPKVTP